MQHDELRTRAEGVEGIEQPVCSALAINVVDSARLLAGMTSQPYGNGAVACSHVCSAPARFCIRRGAERVAAMGNMCFCNTYVCA